MDSLKFNFKKILHSCCEENVTSDTDQQKGFPMPDPQAEVPEGTELIKLVHLGAFSIGDFPVRDAIESRASIREYKDLPVSFEALSYLLWATQGVREVNVHPKGKGITTFRTVPSAGARHSFETRILVNRVSELKQGLYHYMPIGHKIYMEKPGRDITVSINNACFGQFITNCAAAFIWTAVPYRMEWRYGARRSPKLIAIDAGHVCQNLYIAAESIRLGVCALGAYNQEKMDEAIGVDGEEEFVIYLATVGLVK